MPQASISRKRGSLTGPVLQTCRANCTLASRIYWRGFHWYNPKTRSVEDTSTPSTDEEASERLRGNISSEAFLTVYDRLRAEGMAIEQALIFVGHHFRLRHLEYRPSR